MKIDEYEIPVEEYEGAFLDFIYGSNGKQGGDSGHGCRTIIKIESRGADLRANGKEIDTLELVTGGDGELMDLVYGLQEVVNKLSEIYNLTNNKN